MFSPLPALRSASADEVRIQFLIRADLQQLFPVLRRGKILVGAIDAPRVYQLVGKDPEQDKANEACDSRADGKPDEQPVKTGGDTHHEHDRAADRRRDRHRNSGVAKQQPVAQQHFHEICRCE